MRVRFTPSARNQLLGILDHVNSENPRAAEALFTRLSCAASRLTDFPESGRAIPEFPTLHYREIVLPPYRLFYRTVDDTVWIVAVWHDKQLPRPIE